MAAAAASSRSASALSTPTGRVSHRCSADLTTVGTRIGPRHRAARRRGNSRARSCAMTDTIPKTATAPKTADQAKGAANQSGAHLNKDAYKEAKDFLPLNGVDHVEFWVGNAKQAAHYYRALWGFTPIAYAGLETGVRDRTSYVLRQNEITLVVTGTLGPDTEIAEHVRKHG